MLQYVKYRYNKWNTIAKENANFYANNELLDKK